MSLAAPLFLALAALALPVTVLYILKVKRRPVSVPYLRLWESLFVETRARSLFRRLKRLYSLLLQLLILAALVLALAQPAFELSSVKRESVLLLLDVSASMNAREADGRTRFEALLERARAIVEDRSFEDEMMLATVSDRVDVLGSFDRSTLRLRAALAGVEPTRRSLDVGRAIDFARSVTDDREHPVVLFLSDGAGGAVAEALADFPPDADGAPRAHLIPIGEASENVGILRFSARKNTSLGTDYVLAVVRNFGTEVAEAVTLDLKLDGSTQKAVERTLQPGEEIVEKWQLRLPEGGLLSLHLDHEDALDVDDEAFAVVRPNRLRRVVLVTSSAERALPFWLAFVSMGELISAESIAVTAEEYAALSAEERAADVTICVGVLPDELPSAGNLILMDTPLPDSLPARQTGAEPSPLVWDWDREHLLNRYLNWRDLPIPPARTLALDGGLAVVESYEGPLVSAFDLAGRMAVYVAFDMTAELFPFRLAFPMLLRNAIAWFEVEEDLVLEASYAPGSTIRPLRRIAAEAVTASFWRGEAAVEERLALRDGRFLFTETEELGLYHFDTGAAAHATCVNLFDAAESSIAPPEPDPEGAASGWVESGRHFLNRDLWALFALVGLVLWTLEWALFHRRITE